MSKADKRDLVGLVLVLVAMTVLWLYGHTTLSGVWALIWASIFLIKGHKREKARRNGKQEGMEELAKLVGNYYKDIDDVEKYISELRGHKNEESR